MFSWSQCLHPGRYTLKWFILTSQYLCYVERPFPKERIIAWKEMDASTFEKPQANPEVDNE